MLNKTCRLSWLVLALAVAIAAPAAAETFLVYSQGGIPPGNLFVWCGENQPPFAECNHVSIQTCATDPQGGTYVTPEGGTGFEAITDFGYAGWGVFPAANLDLSDYLGGNIRLWLNAPDATDNSDPTYDPNFNLFAEFTCRLPSLGNPLVSYRFDLPSVFKTGDWTQVNVPLAGFINLSGTGPFQANTECLENVVSPFLITADNFEGDPIGGSGRFLIDYIRWFKPNAAFPAPRSVVTVQGRQLLVDGEPFAVNGVAYAPVSIGENWQGAWRDRSDRYLIDFPMMAASGVNTVRLYAPVLTTALLNAAWANGLYVIPQFNVDPVELTCAEAKTESLNRFVDLVNEWKDHPAILFWLVGNELNIQLDLPDPFVDPTLCGDWYPHLESLVAASHAAEGADFHPVTTAVAGIGDVCPAACSVDVDLWGVQVYPSNCSLTSTFNTYAAKSCTEPLVVTEFGYDAWDRILDVEDQTFQASCIGNMIDNSDANLALRTPGAVGAGQVVFEWADEWWKSDDTCGTGWENHDTCDNPGTLFNEEWWGLVALVDGDDGQRLERESYDTVGDLYNLGNVCDMKVATFDSGSGATDITYDPAPGSSEHTLYYGPLGSVSSYGYSGSVTSLGANGSSSLTLPGGSLFWLVVGRDNAAEGGYGTGVGERPASPGAAVPQDANRTGLCM